MKAILFILFTLASCALKASEPDGVEFTKMRIDYAAKPNSILTWVANTERQTALSYFEKDKKKFVEAAAAWLEKCPVDAKAQLMMAYALSDIGRSRDTVKYRYIYYGLIQSIVGNHDGFSKDSAFKVISVDEEYTLCSYLGAEVAGQRLDGFFDVLSVTVKGEKKDLYFDASIPLKALSERLRK